MTSGCYCRGRPLPCEAPAEGLKLNAKTDFGTNGLISSTAPRACAVMLPVHAYFICSSRNTAEMTGKTVWLLRWRLVTQMETEREERVDAVLRRVAADGRLNGQKYLLQLYLCDCCSNHSDSISWEEKYCDYLGNKPCLL